MTSVALGLCAAAVLCVPVRWLAPTRGFGRPAGRRPSDRWRETARRAGRVRCVVGATTAVLLALLGVLPAVPAAALAMLAGLAVHLGWTAGERRRRRDADEASVDCVAALAAELRAGRAPPGALATVAEHAAGPLSGSLAAAARTAALGGDTASVLRDSEGTAGALGRVAAAWQLSEAAGCSLAAVLDAVDADLRARRHLRRLLGGLLSGPRATAGLLAVLPGLGLAMGAGLGADPLHVLIATGPGQLALLAGVCLDVAGVLWTSRLVRSAGG